MVTWSIGCTKHVGVRESCVCLHQFNELFNGDYMFGYQSFLLYVNKTFWCGNIEMPQALLST